MAAQEWFSAADLAALGLPGLPTHRSNIVALATREAWNRPEWENDRWRQRTGRGGGIEYHASVLPPSAQTKLAMQTAAVPQHSAEADARAAAKSTLAAEELWAWFARQPAAKRKVAAERLNTLLAIDTLIRNGTPRTNAVLQVMHERKVGRQTLYNWQTLVRGTERQTWLPRLCPHHTGRQDKADCTPEAWDFLRSDYLRPERPNFEDCYRRLTTAAGAHGWKLPSARTLRRRIEALPEGVRVLARHGEDAAKRLYPAQERDRSVFHALEAVNIDGHTWDVRVQMGDEVGRVSMVGIQDLYSGMILAWRLDRSENKEAVRLAIGDVVENYGIFDHIWLDNGRAFASKSISGGAPTRYRFKVSAEEPDGLLKTLGTEIHWTNVYSGQSKPIERAWRDFAQNIAKDPRLSGAWTGNNPMNKPSNYASKAIGWDLFAQVVAEGVAEHNARAGRTAANCRGRSFAATFAESYAKSPIRKATPDQRRLWLLAAEAVTVRRETASIHLQGNRYWSEWLLEHRGQKVVLRFDPDALQDDVHVYRLDGTYLGAAPCVEAVGFADAEAAREHGRARRAWLRATREAVAAERRMTIQQVADLMPQQAPPAPPPETRIVRPVFGNTALQPVIQEEEEPRDGQREVLAAVRHLWGGPRLAAVPDDADE